jgi:hypothetical protein
MRKARLKLELRELADQTNVYHLPPSPLKFWVDPGHEAPPYEVDLREFANGKDESKVPHSLNGKFYAGFNGRPGLTAQFSEVIQLFRPSKMSANGWRFAMRGFFRYLDSCDPMIVIDSVAKLTDGHGPGFLLWLEEGNSTISNYGRVKTVVDRMRELQALPHLFWSAKKSPEPAEQQDIDQDGIRRFYHALKDEARQIKAMFKEGTTLADSGKDPRGRRGTREESAGWKRRENHAWLVREMTKDRLIPSNEFKNNSVHGLNKSNSPLQKFGGPTYLAPLMNQRGSEGIVGKLRWFHPSYHDTAVFLWLFMVGTGWNCATATSLDVSVEENWVERHPQKAEFVVLHAYKGRADRHVFALSMRDPEWHPYQIVKFMIERTAALRQTVRDRLSEARALYEKFPSLQNASQVAELEAIVKSPWLYHVVNSAGRVDAFSHADISQLNRIARASAKRKAGLLERHPQIAMISTTIARDAWIGYSYVQSGYNVLIARLAGQHSSLRTLKHYLKRRRYRAHSEQQSRLWQDAAFSEILDGRLLDATRIRILVMKGQITCEEERRLLDYRQRTRLGMGCLSPRNPPKYIAPDHVSGMICRVQRCTGCEHGVIFADSLRSLAQAFAELIFILRSIPYVTWKGSSLEEEFESINLALESFPKEDVEREVQQWLNKLERGEVLPHDTYPSY